MTDNYSRAIVIFKIVVCSYKTEFNWFQNRNVQEKIDKMIRCTVICIWLMIDYGETLLHRGILFH